MYTGTIKSLSGSGAKHKFSSLDIPKKNTIFKITAYGDEVYLSPGVPFDGRIALVCYHRFNKGLIKFRGSSGYFYEMQISV